MSFNVNFPSFSPDASLEIPDEGSTSESSNLKKRTTPYTFFSIPPKQKIFKGEETLPTPSIKHRKIYHQTEPEISPFENPLLSRYLPKIEKPPLSSLLPSPGTPHKGPPPTPRKPPQKKGKAYEIVDTLKRQGFELEFAGKGHFHQVYIPKSKFTQELNGCPLDQVVVKVINEYALNRNFGKANRLIDPAFAQYNRIKDDLNVVHVFNNPIVDHFWVTQKVATDIPLPLSEKHLDQLVDFFAYSINKREPLDLKLDNFGIDQNGDLILLDFYEENDPESFHADLNSRIKHVANSLDEDQRTKFLNRIESLNSEAI